MLRRCLRQWQWRWLWWTWIWRCRSLLLCCGDIRASKDECSLSSAPRIHRLLRTSPHGRLTRSASLRFTNHKPFKHAELHVRSFLRLQRHGPAGDGVEQRDGWLLVLRQRRKAPAADDCRHARRLRHWLSRCAGGNGRYCSIQAVRNLCSFCVCPFSPPFESGSVTVTVRARARDVERSKRKIDSTKGTKHNNHLRQTKQASRR